MHWRALALDQEQIPLTVDDTLYSNCDKKGILHVVTARKDGLLVGYIFFWVLPHPHYKDFGLQASTDAFFVMPEHRKGGLGARMLMYAESSLRKSGVKKVGISVKLHEDHSDVMEALGWKATDKVFAKCL
jgi:GNAT superfamily N-acetyltransferase